MTAVALPRAEGCWNTVGVNGDASCPELAGHVHCRNCPVFSAAGYALYDREPPPGYSEEWTERLAHPEPRTTHRTYPVVLFRVATEWLALDVAFAVEVAPVRTVRRLPHQTDRLLAGLVNIRGELLPAVDLAHLLGAGTGEPAKPDPLRQRLLVAERDAARWVFLVDEVFDARHFAEADLGNLPGTVGPGPASFTRGVFRWGDRAVGYLDPDRLFAALARSFR